MQCWHCYADIYYYGTSADGEKLYLKVDINGEEAKAKDLFCDDLHIKHKIMPVVRVKNG